MTTITLNRLPREILIRNIVLASIGRLTSTIEMLETWRLRQKSRAQFAGLDSRVLRDSGISEAHRFIESNKPFWEE